MHFLFQCIKEYDKYYDEYPEHQYEGMSVGTFLAEKLYQERFITLNEYKKITSELARIPIELSS